MGCDLAIFGDKTDFAIECGVDAMDGPLSKSVFGHMCVWCGGVPLGDIDELQCGLYGAYAGFTRVARYLDRLWAPELAELSDEAAWNFLDGILYGYHGDVELADDGSLDELRRDRRWHSFDFLTNWGEQFDRYKSFVLSPPGENARVLTWSLPAKSVLGISVSKRGLVAAVADFEAWFETEDLKARNCI